MTLVKKNGLPRSKVKTAHLTNSMRYKDLREWLAIVDRLGELVQIERAHRDLEIGALTEIVRRQNKTRVSTKPVVTSVPLPCTRGSRAFGLVAYPVMLRYRPRSPVARASCVTHRRDP